MRPITAWVLLFLLAVSTARAENCTQINLTFSQYGTSSGWMVGTVAQACAVPGLAPDPVTYGISAPYVSGSGTCRVDRNAGGYFDASEDSRTGDYCAASNPCLALAGQTKILNETTGWARTSTPDANDRVSEVSGGYGAGATSSCDGQCTVTYQAIDSCWRSQVPAANGLHRLSCDLRVQISATQCTAKSSPQDSTVAPPSCPGYVGQVNGKPVCVGTAGSPLPQGSTSPAQPPEAVGNPSAGDKPGSGSGSGSTGSTRTPTSGDGGNAGGGSSAATPGGGSEGNGQTAGTRGGATVITGEVEVDIETCGLPGKPPCKIDETGTPDGTSLQAKVTAIGTAGTALVEGVNDVSQPSTFGWVFGVSLPESACSALQFYKPGGTWSIDPCNSSLVNTMRLLLAWFFALATALYCWRTVTAAVGND